MTRLLAMAAGLAVAIGGTALGQATNQGTAADGAKVTTQPKPDSGAPAPKAASRNANKADPTLKSPTLYLVGYAHLDTQWRWTYPQVIREFIPATLHGNFALFEKYPSYVFNFSGSRRYQMMKEYYPADYAKMKEYIKAGKWFTCGSSVDENDANVPSAESLIRHVLYGNKYFRNEFGTESDEFMLPDCFGFPASMPSVLSHCGLKGFSTQKLTWGGVVPIPFKVGVWKGPDGHGVIAALDPGAYVGEVLENLANSNGWLTRINANGEKSGVFADYHYYGTGDRGGAPSDKSVAMVEQSVNTDGKVRTISSKADDLFKAITPEMREKLPSYTGELELTEHSAGSLTSAAYMKRWNRLNEQLADAAERASVLAWWMGGREYPHQKLEDAWYLVLGSQMHDILPGTSHPVGYDYSQNDEVIAANQFTGVLTDALGAIESQMNTKAAGTALLVYNPLSIDREGVVEAEVPGDSAKVKGVEVTGPAGKAVPAQLLGAGRSAGTVKIAFLAKVPSVGFASFDARLTDKAVAGGDQVKVSDRQIENGRYTVKLNDAGDVSSIFDKQARREMLAAPITIQQCYEKPAQWPAWNQDWADRIKPPMEVVGGPAEFKVVESGPVRGALEVTRHVGSSTFKQLIRLEAGGDRVEFANTIDWNARERSLRVAFPMTVSNKNATWDGQTGTVQRGNVHQKQYEYAGQFWMDLTDTKGDYGVSIHNDSKYASDKPNDNTLRLTLLHTPGVNNEYQDQGCQDIGRHHVTFAVQGHEGDWRKGKTAFEAAEVNQPMRSFLVPSHDGPMGKAYSLAKVEGGNVMITALKKAEASDHVIVRLRELDGKPAKDLRVTFGQPVAEALEVDGQERVISKAKIENGQVVSDINGYELRAFAVKLGTPAATATAATSTSIKLPFDTDVVSTNDKRTDGAMSSAGAYPAEQLPETLTVDDATFTLGSVAAGAKNAVACNGQEIAIPAGEGGRLYILAAAGGDIAADVQVDGQTHPIQFRDWKGYVGHWDRRLWSGEIEETSFNWKNPLVGLEPGFIKDTPIAWYASHYHKAEGDAYYMFCYLFKHAIDLPKGAKSVKLPTNPKVKVFAMTLVKNAGQATPAAPLFDTLDDRSQDAPFIKVPSAKANLNDVTSITIEPKLYYTNGSLHYTADGTEPSATSPTYGGPIFLHAPTTIKAAIIGAGGKSGPVATAKIDVNDTTAPSVVRASTSYKSRTIRVELSEPVDFGGAHFGIQPPIVIDKTELSADRRSFILTLESPLEIGKEYKLLVGGVRDLSPKENTMSAVHLGLTVPKPVFKLDEVGSAQMGATVKDTKGLPINAGDSWTMNMFVRADKQPDERTLIAGFGSTTVKAAGTGRFLARFRGIHFWSHNTDVASRTPLELGKWQMLTATYDGTRLRLYKDAELIGNRDITLSTDVNEITFAPIDPWEKQRKFEGQIKHFSIWPAAMGEEGLKALQAEAKLE